jgi:DNA-binding response OmpR family regulator
MGEVAGFQQQNLEAVWKVARASSAKLQPMRTPAPASFLLVEDDPLIRESIELALAAEGLTLVAAGSVAAARAALTDARFDVILLDVGLPDGNGIELCREIRRQRPQQAIVFLTARADEDTAVAALTAGGDDHLRKPFGMRELLARSARAWRAHGGGGRAWVAGALVLDADTNRVECRGRIVHLPRRELQLLQLLMRRAGAVLRRDDLLAAIDEHGQISDRTLDSHVSHLRQRLRAARAGVTISAEYGTGYRLVTE